jgi:hypothetical protein
MNTLHFEDSLQLAAGSFNISEVLQCGEVAVFLRFLPFASLME